MPFHLACKDFGPKRLHFFRGHVLDIVEESGSPVVIGFMVLNLVVAKFQGRFGYNSLDVTLPFFLLETEFSGLPSL